MLEITVPCQSCGEQVRFGYSKCAKCGAVVSRAAKHALHARLAASSDDYRELLDQVSSARTALLIASLLYLVIGAIAFVGSSGAHVTPEHDWAVGGAFLVNALVASAFLGLWWLARTRPAFAMASAVVLWLAFQALLAVVFPVAVRSGLWMKGVVAILMIRGIIAAFRAHAFRRKLQRS